MYDLIITGSGPAGLSAAIYAKRGRLSFLVVEKNGFSGGQIMNTEQVDNYLGLNGISGYDLAMKFREHADRLGVEFETGEVVSVEPGQEKEQGQTYRVTLKSGKAFDTRAVLIATGARHRPLGVPGEAELTGKGVSYCATCDGAFYRDKTVAVVGGGDVAVEDALYLSRLCRQVYLIHRREGLRAAQYVQEQLKRTENITFLPYHEVLQIAGKERVDFLKLVENQTNETKELAVAGVFIAVGMLPETDVFSDLVRTDSGGYICAGEDGITSVPGIFAAGDVRTKPLRQIVTAVSDGANAVASVERYLYE